MSGTITSANANVAITVPDVFPIPQILGGFAADDAFAQQAIEISEVRMGVDGKLSGGYTPNPYEFQVTFQPDSDSILVFDNWGLAIKAAKDTLRATNMTIAMPSIGKVFLFTKGFLKNWKPLPDAKKVLEPQTYSIAWEDVTAVPL